MLCSCIQSIIEIDSILLCSGCVRLCSTLLRVLELYWLTKLDLILHNLAAIWLMKTIANVPYFLLPKSTVHSSTTNKFSTTKFSRLSNFCEASPYTVN